MPYVVYYEFQKDTRETFQGAEKSANSILIQTSVAINSKVNTLQRFSVSGCFLCRYEIDSWIISSMRRDDTLILC